MDIEMRMARLERSAARWRAATLGLMALACVAAQGQPTVTRFDEIRVRGLTVTDRQDRTRAALDVDDHGKAISLVLFDGDENSVARFEIDTDGRPSITLKDPAAKARAVLDISKEHVGTLMVSDGEGHLVGKIPED